jgi:hypothetical protein
MKSTCYFLRQASDDLPRLPVDLSLFCLHLSVSLSLALSLFCLYLPFSGCCVSICPRLAVVSLSALVWLFLSLSALVWLFLSLSALVWLYVLVSRLCLPLSLHIGLDLSV